MNDGLYVRGGLDDEWILILNHENFRSREVRETIDIQNLLKENNQVFSNKTQLKIIATNGDFTVDFNLLEFELNVIKIAPEVLSATSDVSYSVYPNPGQDYLVVEAGRDYPIALFNTSGQMVIEGMTNQQIDVSDLKPAFYIGKTYNQKGQTFTFKWIKGSTVR